MRYFITLFLYFIFQQNSLATPLKDFTASYDLYHNEFYVGKSQRHLKTENKFLTYTSIAKTAGLAAVFFDVTVTETSKMRFKDKQLNFFSYNYHEKSSDKDEGYQLRLDKKEQFYNTHTEKSYPVTKLLHDTLGFSVAIMPELQAGKREIQFDIASKDKLEKYSLKFIKKEILMSDNGEITTLKMEHYDPKTQDRFTFWCAEKLGYLPVRIKSINHKGDENLLNLTQFNQKAINLALDDDEEFE